MGPDGFSSGDQEEPSTLELHREPEDKCSLHALNGTSQSSLRLVLRLDMRARLRLHLKAPLLWLYRP